MSTALTRALLLALALVAYRSRDLPSAPAAAALTGVAR